MFRLKRASRHAAEELLATALDAATSSPHFLTVTGGLLGNPPQGFAHDLSRTELGRGRNVFVSARQAFQRWEQFDLGWVQVLNPTARIAPGELVAVEAHTACLWSINFSRVDEVEDSPNCFGFMYTTTAFHVEEGQERFVVNLDPESGSVSYLIEAVSRPRHPLARIAHPFSRAMQRRFARDSHRRMKRCAE